MKKLLLTAALGLMSWAATFAQDPSEWKEGQEVTSELGWVNTKYEGSSDGWQTGGNAGVNRFYDPERCETGSVELYDNPIGAEYYQVMWLPAGYYKFTVQGFYRPGSAWAAGWDTNTDQNGQFFCDEVTIDEEPDDNGNDVLTVTGTNNMQLRLIVSDGSEEMILLQDMCTDANGGTWQRDHNFTKDGVTYYVPNSMWGASLHFDLYPEKYENELMVIHPEDGWVKIGIRKAPDSVSGGDWIIFNNFRAYYISDAGEAVQLLLAQEKYYAAQDKAAIMIEDIREEFGALAALLEEEVMTIDDSFGTVEECEASLATLQGILDKYQQYLSDARALVELIAKCEALNANALNEDFSEAIVKALLVATDGNDDTEPTLESGEEYTNAINDLKAARLAFLLSGGKVDGAYDFTALVNYPWFCQPQYEPTWDAENNCWVPNQAALETLSERSADETWDQCDDVNGTINNIAAGVNVYGKEGTPGVWAQYGNGGNLEVYWNDRLTCIKKWSAPFDGYHIVSQKLVDIPNGYYTLKALGQTWMNDWGKDGAADCQLHIFAKSSNGEVNSDYLEKGGWWGKDINQWKELSTDLIQVTDGELTIGCRDNGFAAWTGFRIFYYGEELDFTTMITLQRNKFMDSYATQLLFEGDRDYVWNMAEPYLFGEINDAAEYEEAKAVLEEAFAYIELAKPYAHWNLKQQIEDARKEYTKPNPDEDAEEEFIYLPEYPIFQLYIDNADAILKNSESTYENAKAADADFAALKEYLEARKAIVEYKRWNDNIDAVLEKHLTELTFVYADEDMLAQYIAELKVEEDIAIKNKANDLFADIPGIDKASLTNPVEITQFLKNPTFNDGPATDWDCVNVTPTNNTYGRNVAECWNAQPFEVSQSIVLPKGSYEVRVRALYRTRSTVDEDMIADFENGTFAYNALLFANGQATPIKSVCDGGWDEPSFSVWYNAFNSDSKMNDEIMKVGNDLGFKLQTESWSSTLCIREDELGLIADKWLDYDDHYDDDLYYVYESADLSAERPTGKFDFNEVGPRYPFDIEVAGKYYPCSTISFQERIAKTPDAYCNSVITYLPENGLLKLGLLKVAQPGEENEFGNDKKYFGDWIIYDDFQLFYLGTEMPDAIDEVAATAKTQTTGIFSVSGTKVNGLQKGINIVKMNNGEVKKILIK